MISVLVVVGAWVQAGLLGRTGSRPSAGAPAPVAGSLAEQGCEPGSLEVEIGGHVETPQLPAGVNVLDCPKPEFRGILKVLCEAGRPRLLQETCVWETSRAIVMQMSPGMVPPRVIQQMRKEAYREVERLRRASAQADTELKWVESHQTRAEERTQRLTTVKDNTLIDMNRTDLTAQNLDKMEEEALQEVEKMERNYNFTQLQHHQAGQLYDEALTGGTAEKLHNASLRVHQAKRSMEGGLQSLFGAVDVLRTVHDEQFGTQKKYGLQYHQLLDVVADLKADTDLLNTIQAIHSEYYTLDVDLKSKVTTQSLFAEKCDQLAKESGAANMNPSTQDLN